MPYRKGEARGERSPFIHNEEYVKLSTELKDLYLLIAGIYKKMSKTNSEDYLSGFQEQANRHRESAWEIRKKLKELRKRMDEEWRKNTK
jgi:hypothetical protein